LHRELQKGNNFVSASEKICKKALNALLKSFLNENIKATKLFVMGVGNVGAKNFFGNKIRSQRKFLKGT